MLHLLSSQGLSDQTAFNFIDKMFESMNQFGQLETTSQSENEILKFVHNLLF